MAFALVIGAFSLSASENGESISMARRHIPSGAILQEFTQRQDDGVSRTVPAIASSDSGTVAFLFRRNSLLGLSVVLNDGVAGEARVPGVFGQNGNPVWIRTLIPEQGPQILVSTSKGASVGSYLKRFRGSK